LLESKIKGSWNIKLLELKHYCYRSRDMETVHYITKIQNTNKILISFMKIIYSILF